MAEALLFFGVTEANEHTIWQSSGTTAGTKPLINANIGVSGGDELGIPGPILFCADNKIYAQAQNSDGNNLLVWDIPTASYDIFNCPTNQSDVLNPQGFAAYDAGSGLLVYFNGTYQSGLTATNELFSTDGTPSGTTMIQGPVVGLNPSSLAVAYGSLFFCGSDGSNDVLFAYNGSGMPAPVGVDVVNPAYLTVSAVGTHLQLIYPYPIRPPPVKLPLFMSGQDSNGATWLYQYDDANLIEIAPASASSSGLQPYNLVSLGWQTSLRVGMFELVLNHSALFFSGVNASNQRGLWMSLGTSETTAEIATPTFPGVSSLNPFNLTSFNNKLYFTGQDTDTGGRGLFVYDPVANRTSEIIASSAADLDPGYWNADWGGLNQITMTVFNNELYFSASGPTGSSGALSVPNLWRTNATLNSHGAATPQQVYIQSGGLEPWSLTTADL
jgi:hypothetical protein